MLATTVYIKQQKRVVLEGISRLNIMDLNTRASFAILKQAGKDISIPTLNQRVTTLKVELSIKSQSKSIPNPGFAGK